MARIKYYYDTESCKYERIKVSKWDVALNILGIFALTLMLGVGMAVLYMMYFDSPKEALVKRENSQLRLSYEILDDEMEEVKEVIKYLQERDDNIYRQIFEAEPIPASIRNAGVGGAERYRELLASGLSEEKMILEAFQKLDKLRKQLYIQTESYDEIMDMAKNKETMLASIPAIQPVPNKDLFRLASGYGMRMHPIYKVRRMHYGVDFSAPRGTPIYATGDGVVTRAKRSNRNVGAGNYIKIDHGYGYETLYFHMHDFVVSEGQQVKRGELIGYVGSTGGSTAPHCHYEVHKDGKPVDPVRFFFQDLNDEEYERLIELAMVENQSLG